MMAVMLQEGMQHHNGCKCSSLEGCNTTGKVQCCDCGNVVARAKHAGKDAMLQWMQHQEKGPMQQRVQCCRKGAQCQGEGAMQCEEVQHYDGCNAMRVPVPAVTHPRGKRWPGRAR